MPNGFILAGTDLNDNTYGIKEIFIRYSTDLSGTSYNPVVTFKDSNDTDFILDEQTPNNYIKLIWHRNNVWIIILNNTDSNINSNVLYSINGGTEWNYLPDTYLFSIDYGKIDSNGTYGWIGLGYDFNNNESVLYTYDTFPPSIINTRGLTYDISANYITDTIITNVTISSNMKNEYILTSDIAGIFIYDSSLNQFTIAQDESSIDTNNISYSIQQDISGNTYLNSTYYIDNINGRVYLKTLYSSYSSGIWALLVNDNVQIPNGPSRDIGRIIMKSDTVSSKWTIKYSSDNTNNYYTYDPNSLTDSHPNAFNVKFNDIATNGAGTWVAVGASDMNYSTNRGDDLYRDGLIVYSQDSGASWTELLINTVYVFNGITYQNGYWIATTANNKTSDQLTSSKSATYISNNLTNWTPVFQNMNISAIQGGSFDLQCLLKGTSISTPSGYVPIENLIVGDKVLMPCGEVKEITNVYASHVFATDKTQPYIIPAGKLGAIKDVYISPTHSVCASNGELIEAQFLGYKQANIEGIIEYYNISLGGNRNNMILADGVAVESMGKDLQKTVLDISSYPAARLFPDNIRNSHIVKLHKQYNIPIKVLQGYPDSYIQELISK